MRPITVLLLALSVALAGCGDDGDDGGAAGPAGEAAALELAAEGVAFSTATLTAVPGEVVIRFDNRDQGIRHNLHVTGDGVDDMTEISAGPLTQTLTLNLRPGTYTYNCDVHPQRMRGQLTIR